ncbi:hypothetical protein CCE02nite_09390 [Cellulosimicrobium cellulans]|uniref:Uncharacterized protein n=1 Tax=Cellulosimicrobium cellulans TaxID=1710 RepID=A0A4Y4DZX7_CELCE|nr:hypothetical protein CCE02nite_09390 [Cellulosimicrobium cellulans]
MGFGSKSFPAATAVPGTATAAVTATATTTFVRFFMQASRRGRRAPPWRPLRQATTAAGAATLDADRFRVVTAACPLVARALGRATPVPHGPATPHHADVTRRLREPPRVDGRETSRTRVRDDASLASAAVLTAAPGIVGRALRPSGRGREAQPHGH